jgi:hypothetical protein
MPPDIQSRIKREFAPEDFYPAIKAINTWDATQKGLIDDRLIRCAVFLAKGNMAVLEQQIALGMMDYRDLIVAAEYEGDIRVRDFSKPFMKTEESA